MTSKIIKIISIIVVCIVVGVATTFYINQRMKVADLNEKLTQTIGKDQGLMEIILKIPGSEITYGEVFELCDKSVNDRIELIISLRGLYPNMKSDLKDSLIDFLSIENELVRDLKQVSRIQMNNEGKKKIITRLSNSEYSDYYYSSIKSGIKEIKDDILNELSSALSFKDKYDNLSNKEVSISKQMNKAGLNFILIFDKYKTANIEEMDNFIKDCQTWLGN